MSSMDISDEAKKELESLMKPRSWRQGRHLPVVRSLAKQCESICEKQMVNMSSTCALLKGLLEASEVDGKERSLHLAAPLSSFYANKAQTLSEDIGGAVTVTQEVDVPDAVDMLLFDTFNHAAHVESELTTQHVHIKKYIVLYNLATAESFGMTMSTMADAIHMSQSSGLPLVEILKGGVEEVIDAFLAAHSEWKVLDVEGDTRFLTILSKSSVVGGGTPMPPSSSEPAPTPVEESVDITGG